MSKKRKTNGRAFTGTIIEESLTDKAALVGLRIVATEVEPVAGGHKTPWLSQWTMHRIEVPEKDAARIAERLSAALEREHRAWYADFKNDARAFVIYPNKVFFIDRRVPAQYEAARRYGIAWGIPEHQIDFQEDALPPVAESESE